MADLVSLLMSKGYNETDARNAASGPRAADLAREYGASSGSGYNAQLGDINKAIDDYVNEIITQTNGDYDFAAKWIEKNYADALGTDNGQRAQFLKQVANSLEQKVGTIAFDYETNKYRTVSDRDLALSRLNYDEQRIKVQNQQDREAQGANLNQRGILSSTRENATGLAGKEVAMLEGGIGERMEALKRNRENVNISSDRALEDITTGARRSALGAQDTRNSQIEQAKRAKEKATKLAEATRSSMKASGEASLYGSLYG
jgi:hypothetical protein